MPKFGRSTPYYGTDAGTLQTLDSGLMVIGDFTDGTSTSGYADVDTNLPAGAIPLGWSITTTTAFGTDASYTPVDGTTIAFVDGAAGDDTITDSADGFVTAGFITGDLITVTGATTSANNTTYTLTNVAAGTLTMATASIDTAEAGIEGISFAATVAAAVSVGVSGDTDKYSADTARDISTTGTVGAIVLAADAADSMGSTNTIRITVTETADFTDYEVGGFVFKMFYIQAI